MNLGANVLALLFAVPAMLFTLYAQFRVQRTYSKYSSVRNSLNVTGADVARKLGLDMVDLNHDEQVMVRAPDAYVMAEFGVARTAYEADVLINLPVIKTHGRTGITCALKNMKPTSTKILLKEKLFEWKMLSLSFI